MGVLAKWFKQLFGVNRGGVVWYTGTLTLSTNGDIASQDCPGFLVTKVAAKAGRYLCQLRNSSPVEDAVANKLICADGKVIGADDTAYTTAKGLHSFLRDDNMAAAGNFLLQFVRSDTAADAEIEDNRQVLISFAVKASSATP